MFMRYLPAALIALRFSLAFVIPILAHCAPVPLLLACCIIVGLVSDIFDGVIARRMGVATPILRRADSAVDVCFYLGIMFAIYLLRPQTFLHAAWMIALLILLEIACHLVSFVRFSRPPATHTYLAKTWGLFLAITCTATLAFGYDGPLIWITFALGVIVDLEVIAILLGASAPPVDVPSLFHLKRLRSA